MVVVNGLASRWKALALMSLLAADEPVAMAMWLGAVSEGVIVMFWLAKTPSLTSNPRPWSLGKTPLDRYCLIRLGTAPSSEMRITDGAAMSERSSSCSTDSCVRCPRRSDGRVRIRLDFVGLVLFRYTVLLLEGCCLDGGR